MKFTEKKAQSIAEKHGLSDTTIRVWRLRGAIPNRYNEKEERVFLIDVLPEDRIDAAIEKYGIEMQRLLESRQFRPGQSNGYYATCLFSLCSECEKMQ